MYIEMPDHYRGTFIFRTYPKKKHTPNENSWNLNSHPVMNIRKCRVHWFQEWCDPLPVNQCKLAFFMKEWHKVEVMTCLHHVWISQFLSEKMVREKRIFIAF